MIRVEGDRWLHCPGCDSREVQRYGKIMSRSGEKQRIKCMSCGKVFYQGKRPRKKVQTKQEVK